MNIAITVVERRRKRLQRMAQGCLLLIGLIVVLSAFLRHRGVGLGCEDWPACYGQELRLAQQGEVVTAGSDVLIARVVHRVVASVMLILVILLMFSSLARPRLRREGGLALSLLALALALAALGVVTPGSRLPAVTLGNLLGGFAMFALCMRLIAVTSAQSWDIVLTRMASLVAILLVLQVALGALVSATHSGLSCRSLAECMELAARGGWNFTTLNPWQRPSLDGIGMASATAGAAIQLAHRIAGLVVAAAVLVLGLLAWLRGRRRCALALAGLLLAVVALGIFIGQGNLPLPAVLLHNLSAVSLLAMVGVTGFGPAACASRLYPDGES